MNTIQSRLRERGFLHYRSVKDRRAMADSFDTISTACSSVDDYGEDDVSLQSYGIDESCGSSSTSSSELTELKAVRKENAVKHHNLLLTRIDHFYEGDCGKQQQLYNSGGEQSWNAIVVNSGGRKIEFSMRSNVTSAFRLSTVVQKVKKLSHNMDNKKNPKKTQCPAPYSLMTKMMKHNAILKQASSGENINDGALLVENEHITAAHNGSFFFSANVNVCILSSSDTFDSIINDFMLKASEIEKDLTKASQACGTKSKLRRRERLLTAYDKTLI